MLWIGSTSALAQEAVRLEPEDLAPYAGVLVPDSLFLEMTKELSKLSQVERRNELLTERAREGDELARLQEQRLTAQAATIGLYKELVDDYDDRVSVSFLGRLGDAAVAGAAGFALCEVVR